MRGRGFENIRIVLVETKHPGNIGAAARAMKTMGVTQLYLVRPIVYPSSEAHTRAVGAHDLLDHAVTVPFLHEALADCIFVIGASARVRGISLPVSTPEHSMTRALQESQNHPVAIVFGREDSGLTNDELWQCHQQVKIPSVHHFHSLNLAAAVQILVYELRKAYLKNAHSHEFNLHDNTQRSLANKKRCRKFL